MGTFSIQGRGWFIYRKNNRIANIFEAIPNSTRSYFTTQAPQRQTAQNKKCTEEAVFFLQ
jgi:hypothetical protein